MMEMVMQMDDLPGRGRESGACMMAMIDFIHADDDD